MRNYKEWEEYLLSVGVTNLDNDEEIDRKLDEIEQENPEYQSILRKAIEEVMTTTNKPVEALTEKDLVNWLLSLGD